MNSSIDKPLDRNNRDANADNAGGQILPTQFAQQSRWTVSSLDSNFPPTITSYLSTSSFVSNNYPSPANEYHLLIAT